MQEEQLSDLTAPLIMLITAGVIIAVATMVARRRDRQHGLRSKRAGGSSVTSDGGVGNFDDTAPTQTITTPAAPTTTAVAAMASAPDTDSTTGREAPKR